jgi:L-arabinokinase
MEEGNDGVSAARQHLVFAYYVSGHGFGHATRVVEVSTTGLFFCFNF